MMDDLLSLSASALSQRIAARDVKPFEVMAATLARVAAAVAFLRTTSWSTIDTFRRRRLKLTNNSTFLSSNNTISTALTSTS